jgi:PAS domain S-box-containing protein
MKEKSRVKPMAVGKNKKTLPQPKKKIAKTKQTDIGCDVEELTGGIVVTLDQQGRITAINRRGAEILGFSREELHLKNWFDHFIPKRLRKEVFAVFRELISGKIEAAEHFVNPVLCRGNSERLFAWNNAYLRDDKNTIINTLSVGIDITDYKQVKDALEKSEKQMQSIIRAAPVGIGMLVGCVIQQANETLCRMTGYSCEELVGKSARILYPSDAEYEYVGGEKYSQIEKRGTGTVETRWKRKDGQIMNIILSSSLFDPADPSKGMTFTALDITERKKAEEQLRREKELITRITELSPVGIVHVDAAGIIQFVNSRVEELMEQPKEDVLGKYYFDAVPVISNEQGQKVDKNAKIDFQSMRSAVYGIERTFTIPNSKKKVLLINISPLFDNAGRYDGSVVTFQDITERRRIDEELQKTEKLESIGVLAGGIAHDFRNLLEGLFGSIELAKIESADPQKAVEHLNRSLSVFERAKDLTEQLLTFSKGGTPLRRITSLPRLVEETARFALSGSAIDFMFEAENGLWDSFIDRNQIAQVINNIVINARQALGDRGKIEITLHNRLVMENDRLPLDPGRYVEVKISDSGPGMEKGLLKKIFDPFFSTKQKGSGLGLSISYAIVKKHDGNITVESEPGKGTSFCIYLPAAAQKASAREPAQEAPIARGSGKILIMDDEEIIRTVTVDMLKSLGYETATAADGAVAVEKFRASVESCAPFSALILDLTVPGGLGGKEIINQLRAIDPDVCAIVSSGYSDELILSHPEEYGFRAGIAKPFRFQELGSLLQFVLEKRERTKK